MANNAPRDTMHKFKPIIERMESVGAFGQEIVVEDGKDVTINRKWKEGDTWGPKPKNPDNQVLFDDEATSTFHGFLPRHNRPNRIGLGHLGYDNIYTRSRDGKSYTSEDLPDREWRQSRNGPIKFVSDQGNTFVVEFQPGSHNAAFEGEPMKIKPLRQILEENQKANAKQAPYQGRSNLNRGGFGGPRPAGSMNQSWN